DERVLRLDETRSVLVADPALGALGPGGILGLAVDAAGNLWRSGRPPTVAPRRGAGWAGEVRSLVEIPARDVDTIFAARGGGAWLAAETGLYRYAGPLGPGAALPAPCLSRLTSGDGALLLGSAAFARARGSGTPELPSGVRRLRIEFAPLSFRPGLRYQTRLDPLDAGSGARAGEPFAELTRLPPGGYTFRVRTVGPSHEEGPETAWSFRILAPWYRTSWALLLWVAAAVGAVFGLAGL